MHIIQIGNQSNHGLCDSFLDRMHFPLIIKNYRYFNILDCLFLHVRGYLNVNYVAKRFFGMNQLH